MKPSFTTVRQYPPGSLSFSTTRTSTSFPARAPSDRIAFAYARPEMPAPTTRWERFSMRERRYVLSPERSRFGVACREVTWPRVEDRDSRADAAADAAALEVKGASRVEERVEERVVPPEGLL